MNFQHETSLHFLIIHQRSSGHDSTLLLHNVWEFCELFDRFVVDFSNWNNRSLLFWKRQRYAAGRGRRRIVVMKCLPAFNKLACAWDRTLWNLFLDAPAAVPQNFNLWINLIGNGRMSNDHYTQKDKNTGHKTKTLQTIPNRNVCFIASLSVTHSNSNLILHNITKGIRNNLQGCRPSVNRFYNRCLYLYIFEKNKQKGLQS